MDDNIEMLYKCTVCGHTYWSHESTDTCENPNCPTNREATTVAEPREISKKEKNARYAVAYSERNMTTNADWSRPYLYTGPMKLNAYKRWERCNETDPDALWLNN